MKTMCLSNDNGKTITLGRLIAGIKDTISTKVYVPMYQRNYKWNQSIAVKLVEDLITAYNEFKTKSISLFTLHIDDESNIQVVDGQQRMITLLLLFTALGKAEDFIKLKFERDFSLSSDKRSDFISALSNVKDVAVSSTDKRRFKYNYSGIKDKLDNDINKNEIEYFITYLKENVTLLLHITKDEPVSEFLNLNCNKTKFSICDRVRSALITYPAFNTIDNANTKKLASMLDYSDYKKGLSALFEEITRLLYIENIYSTVKLGYEDPDKTNENRINIMFCDLLEDSSQGYMKCKSIDDIDKIEILYKLAYYKKMLQELECDKETYQTHRAFRNFHYHNKVKFFELIDNYIKKQDKCNLYDILHMEHSIDKHIFDYTQQNLAGKDTYFVNSYFEVLSKVKKPEKNDSYSSLLEEQFENNSKSKTKYFSLDKNMFESIAQSSGKYILYRYINERHKENESIISFPAMLIFDDVKNVDCTIKVTPLTEITMRELLKNKIIIPVIQRDYCMGSHFSQQDKSDMLDYIIDSYNKEKAITLSAITIFHPKQDEIYIYDGQQRIFTLACLVKLLGAKLDNLKIIFEHRNVFNKFIEKFFDNDEIKVDSYASMSVDNLKKALKKKLSSITKDDLCTYIIEKIKFDVITVNGKLSTAEQFFVEINDGVQLEPYEIFKCKINAKYQSLISCVKEESKNCKGCDIEDCPSINKHLYEKWVSNIDNEWLDYFYKLNETKLTDEDAVEELMEIRLIEFCCRMIYWEKYLNINNNNKHPLELKSFEKSGNEMGDMDIFIQLLTLCDLERISKIMNTLIHVEINEETLPKDESSITCDSKINEDKHNFIIPKFGNKNILKLINDFLKSLKEDIEERSKDIVMWQILNHLEVSEENTVFINKIIAKWNNTMIYSTPFAYVTPSFIGKYENAILQVPSYYYKDKKGWINIFEKLPIKDKLKDKALYEKYDGVLKGESSTASPNNNNQQRKYQIFYKYATSRYNNNEFRDTGCEGDVGKLNDDGYYIECVSSDYKYLRKGNGDKFLKKIYPARIGTTNDDYHLYIDDLVFNSTGETYHTKIILPK